MLLFCPHCSNILRIARISTSSTDINDDDESESTSPVPEDHLEEFTPSPPPSQPPSTSLSKSNSKSKPKPKPKPKSSQQTSTTIFTNRFECPTCTYICPIGRERRFFEEYTHARKDVEDVIGGTKAWENAQKADTRCRADETCLGTEAMFYEIQIRSADEPMTGFYKCLTCLREWRE